MHPRHRPSKSEQASTYFVQDRHDKEELARLALQDEMITTAMGGVLSEQADPTILRWVLDVGCGTGGWAIEAAKNTPLMELAGIDISQTMITHAQERARAAQVADRVEFIVMDALRPLAFPSASFDLVNQRMGGSFVRKWDWPDLLAEFQRVCKPGGIIRLTEANIGRSRTHSPALEHLNDLLPEAFFNAGHYFRHQDDGLTGELVPLMKRCGLGTIQRREQVLTFEAGTTQGRHIAQDLQSLFRTLRPFLEKWTRLPQDYEDLYQQVLMELQQPDFVFAWTYVTVWATVKR